MPRPPVDNVPVNVITGFLGVGKTTAIRAAFAHRPEDERWAVIVNEFGEIGIDGATLGGDAAVAVREIPGGCICCSSGVQLGTTLVSVLRELRPDRVLIEPTGLAMPASVIDLLRAPGLARAVAPRATITLVDPRRFVQPRWAEHDTYKAQVMAADILVANRVDQCTDAELAAYRTAVAALWPAPLISAETSHGRLDKTWLDLAPGVRTPQHIVVSPSPLAALGAAPTHQPEVAASGWIFPTELVFDREALATAIGELLVPDGPLHGRVLRVKGLFRLPRTWVLVNGTLESLEFRPVPWRRDSRVEVIASLPAPDWAVVKALVLSAALPQAPTG